MRLAARRLAPTALSVAPALVVVGLLLTWAVHNGGYDADTWYWGALVMLALLTAVVIGRDISNVRRSRAGMVALVALSLYVAWSYLSISWSQSPGDALQGSNRALLYLLVFATMLVLPWTVEGALLALLVFVLGVGVVAIVLLFRLASADHVAALVISGRLAAPTGYFNSTAALFTIDALAAIALASRRALPAIVRGALIGFACAGLQLAVVVQSRGWLFTLPLVALVSIVLLPDRLRVAATAVLPIAAALVPLHRLLAVYQATPGFALDHAASRAAGAALLLCALAFVAGTLIAWGESLMPSPRPSAARRRRLGVIAAGLAVVAVGVGALAATHGHPVRFLTREWNGFSHEQTASSGSHFADVGSGRYDFWRVSLDAFLARPIGGLGQDNFAEYYVTRRRTDEEPAWTHSLELRLLAHTGIVGFGLFAAFLAAAIAAALRARRRGGLEALVAAAALLPLVVWLIHGSIDWFWEIPALTGPAIGFLAMAAALGARLPASSSNAPHAAAWNVPDATGSPVPDNAALDVPDATASDCHPSPSRRRAVGVLPAAVGAVALVAAVVVLGFPYLSVREMSQASDVARADPTQALRDLSTATELNPLSADPDRLAGTIALSTNRFSVAAQRFQRAISRDPRGWYAWLGAGLAVSAEGERASARHYFEVAVSINPGERVIRRAIDQVDTEHPLTPVAALQLLALDL
jgi:O-Antigen ligase